MSNEDLAGSHNSRTHSSHLIIESKSSQNHADRPPQVIIPSILQPLLNLDQILVVQEHELAELVCGCECNNSYSVKNARGKELYKVREATGCCCRLCCGKSRAFTAIIDDFEGTQQIIMKRNLAWNNCFCPCCLNKVKVKSSDGEFYGSVNQRCTLCTTKFSIKDSHGDTVLRIFGPCCTTSCCCGDVVFKICSKNGDDVGKISKKWGGILKETFTDVDTFGISFPPDLDVKIKAVLLSASILIDFMFFEEPPKKVISNND